MQRTIRQTFIFFRWALTTSKIAIFFGKTIQNCITQKKNTRTKRIRKFYCFMSHKHNVCFFIKCFLQIFQPLKVQNLGPSHMHIAYIHTMIHSPNNIHWDKDCIWLCKYLYLLYQPILQHILFRAIFCIRLIHGLNKMIKKVNAQQYLDVLINV